MRREVHNASVRPPAVAGLFYPDDASELRDVVARYLLDANVSDLPALPPAIPPATPQATPKAMIVPHAGYIYSGPVAAAAYALIAQRRREIRRVVVIGPSHRVYLQGIAAPQAAAFATPLGDVAIDLEYQTLLLAGGDVISADAPHAQEHCLEVQLPFLQMILDDFTLLPLLVGSATPHHIATVLASVWGSAETLVLVSSDLSHYHPYDVAQRIDRATSDSILRRATDLSGEQACGAACINGLLQLARERQLNVTEVVRRNSGDTAGDRDRVVGYGAFAVHEVRLA